MCVCVCIFLDLQLYRKCILPKMTEIWALPARQRKQASSRIKMERSIKCSDKLIRERKGKHVIEQVSRRKWTWAVTM